MTNKEAIEILKEEWRINSELFGKQFDEALNIAIKALEERPTEKWIYHEEWKNEGGCGYECSCCGRTYDYDMNVCGYCGADMREEKEE